MKLLQVVITTFLIVGFLESANARKLVSGSFEEQIGAGSLSSSDICKREMQDPVLAATSGAVGETEAETDEFDLGDLDF